MSCRSSHKNASSFAANVKIDIPQPNLNLSGRVARSHDGSINNVDTTTDYLTPSQLRQRQFRLYYCISRLDQKRLFEICDRESVSA